MTRLAILRQNTMTMVVAGVLLLFAVLGRRALESVMFTHLLLQMPLLILSGVLTANLRPPVLSQRRPALHRFWRQCDAHGLASMLMLLFCCAYWMVPNAIERAVVNPFDEFTKFFSLVLAGALLPGALRKSHVVAQLFFVGGIAWMMAMAGMVYQDASQRLCNSYLLRDQIYTGVGLIMLAVILPAWWAAARLRAAALKKRGALKDKGNLHP